MLKKKKKSHELINKARKKSSKFHKFIHYGLKQKMRCWILSPLVIGILLTVVFSFLIIIYVEPLWFSITSFFN